MVCKLKPVLECTVYSYMADHLSVNQWIFLPPDTLDKEKFNVELIVQCIRISKMPQTHHHALLLLGAVAGMFPVSNTWHLGISYSHTQLCSMGKNFLKGARGKMNRSLHFQDFLLHFSWKQASVLMLWSSAIYGSLWSAVKMEEAFWHHPCLTCPLWSQFSCLVSSFSCFFI